MTKQWDQAGLMWRTYRTPKPRRMHGPVGNDAFNAAGAALTITRGTDCCRHCGYVICMCGVDKENPWSRARRDVLVDDCGAMPLEPCRNTRMCRVHSSVPDWPSWEKAEAHMRDGGFAQGKHYVCRMQGVQLQVWQAGKWTTARNWMSSGIHNSFFWSSANNPEQPPAAAHGIEVGDWVYADGRQQFGEVVGLTDYEPGVAGAKCRWHLWGDGDRLVSENVWPLHRLTKLPAHGTFAWVEALPKRTRVTRASLPGKWRTAEDAVEHTKPGSQNYEATDWELAS